MDKNISSVRSQTSEKSEQGDLANILKLNLCFLLLFLFFTNCSKTDKGLASEAINSAAVEKTEWQKDAIIYQVNIGQFTPDGTFRAFESHIPRLKNLGVKVLWLLPIHPIGEMHRAGTLGNPYAVKNYYEVNEEFGTSEDLKHLIHAIHEAGLFVIIDWVPGFTASDNPLVVKQPEWYQRDKAGQFVQPDAMASKEVFALDYSENSLKDYMIHAMLFWIEEFDLDGFHFVGAGNLPPKFWRDSKEVLSKTKEVFLLGEWEGSDAHESFDVSYSSDLEKSLQRVSRGEENAKAITGYLASMLSDQDIDQVTMNFTSSYKLNADKGTVFDRFGKAAEAFAVLTYTIEGIPMISSGQEVGLKRSLARYEKDSIPWGDHPFNALYDRLGKLKKDNVALWNGSGGGRVRMISNNNQEQVVSFARVKEENTVIAIFNLSDTGAGFQLTQDGFDGSYRRFKSRDRSELRSSETLQLPAWGYEIYIR